MSLVTITTSKTNIANISTVLAELNIKVNDNQSTVMGYQAGTQLKGIYNTILGYYSARESLLANAFTVLGYGAGPTVNADSNTIVGSTAGASTKAGSNNVFLGANSGGANVEGSLNTYLGTAAAEAWTGSANVVVGYAAGSTTSAASSNVVLGLAANSAADNSLVIGAESENTGRNSILLGGRIQNAGANCFIVSTAHESAPTPSMVNAENGCIYIDGRIVGTRSNDDPDAYHLRYYGEDVTLCVSGQTGQSNPMLTGNRQLTTVFSKINLNYVDAQSLSFFVPGGESNVRWTIATGPAYSRPSPAASLARTVQDPGTSATSRAADLQFRSANSNAVVFTDEFAPELFNFTAKHRCGFAPLTESTSTTDLSELTGLVVISLGRYLNLDGTTVPTIDEALPVLELARQPRDSRVFGVIAGFEDRGEYSRGNPDPTRLRAFRLGHLRFHVPKPPRCPPGGGSRVVVNSLGEGAVWVCDANGALKNGDLICSSALPGYGMRQGSDAVTGCTVAKITCDCDFSEDCIVPRRRVGSFACCFVGCSYKC